MSTFRVTVPFEVEAQHAEEAHQLVYEAVTDQDGTQAPRRVMLTVGVWCLGHEMTVTAPEPATSSEIHAVTAALRTARTPEDRQAAFDRFQELIARGWKYDPRSPRRAL